jgi:hypothetical protein
VSGEGRGQGFVFELKLLNVNETRCNVRLLIDSLSRSIHAFHHRFISPPILY